MLLASFETAEEPEDWYVVSTSPVLDGLKERGKRSEQQAAHHEVEPVQRHIGDRVAHQCSRCRQEMVAAGQARYPNAQHDLQAEKREAAAEHSSR